MSRVTQMALKRFSLREASLQLRQARARDARVWHGTHSAPPRLELPPTQDIERLPDLHTVLLRLRSSSDSLVPWRTAVRFMHHAYLHSYREFERRLPVQQVAPFRGVLNDLPAAAYHGRIYVITSLEAEEKYFSRLGSPSVRACAVPCSCCRAMPCRAMPRHAMHSCCT